MEDMDLGTPSSADFQVIRGVPIPTRNVLCDEPVVLSSPRLPNDVWLKILSETDIMTIATCRLVCRQLHYVSYEILKHYRNVSLFKLFSDMKRTPTEDDVANTLNALPELTYLTIRVSDVFFRFNVGDIFCRTHMSNTLRSVVFYNSDLNSKNLISFIHRCPSVRQIQLSSHDSINNQLCTELIKYCHNFAQTCSRRRFTNFDLLATRNVSKDIVSSLVNGFVADTVGLNSLGQLDHLELGVHEDGNDAIEIMNNHTNISNTDMDINSYEDEPDFIRGEKMDIDTETTPLKSSVVLNANQHLRRLTIGINGGTTRMHSLEIIRCPLYAFRIYTPETSSGFDPEPLSLRRLNLTYGRWLAEVRCEIPNAFSNVEHLDLTGSDALRPTALNRLFGLGHGPNIMRRLRSLVLCETLIDILELHDYPLLTNVDASSCTMLKRVSVRNCPRLEEFTLDCTGGALTQVDIHVPDGCVMHGMPDWIQKSCENETIRFCFTT